MNELEKLCNIGEKLSKQLNDVDIYTYDELKNIGSRKAWLKIKSIDSGACINRLMALEGAIKNIRWHNLPEADKLQLKEFYEKNKY